MKALSVRQPWADRIARGQKTIETRTWPTSHRGPLLIVSTRRPELPNLPTGKAVCVCDLVDCRPMKKADEPAADCVLYAGAWSWVLSNIQRVDLVSIRGQQGLYDVDDGMIKILADGDY